MTTFLIILFAITNIYLSVIERFRNYAKMMAVQGVLLFGIALAELTKIDWLNLTFVVSETLIFKVIIVPLLMFKIINKTKIYKVHQHSLPSFYSLIFTIIGLIISVLFTQTLNNKHIDTVYFTIALFTLYSGMFMVISHRKIFSHLVGFLVVENAVFLLSLAVGNEMPIMINSAILLDIFVTVLIITIFINKIGDQTENFEVDDLTTLKH